VQDGTNVYSDYLLWSRYHRTRAGGLLLRMFEQKLECQYRVMLTFLKEGPDIVSTYEMK